MRNARLALCWATALIAFAGRAEATPQTLYGLIQTPSFNELITFDLNQTSFTSDGYQPVTVTPLGFSNVLPQNSITSIAIQGPALYGLIQTPRFNELIKYDLNQTSFTSDGYQTVTVTPLSFSNVLPQNSITSIAVLGSTLYGLIQTPRFNELVTYDLNQTSFTSDGYEPVTVTPLSFSNVLPQNSIRSIAVQGSTLYGLIQTPLFNELITYNLNQTSFTSDGYEPVTVTPLSFSNVLPQNSITSIAVQGSTLYSLIRTPRLNELITYNLNQTSFTSDGFEPVTVTPLSFSNVLPQNSIVDIAVDQAFGSGGGTTPISEPGGTATWLVLGMAFMFIYGSRRQRRQ